MIIQRNLIIILCLLLIFISCNSGCIFNEDSGWNQGYHATYNQILNSSAIILEFEENNIQYTYSPADEFGHESIIFYFGKGINNESIESSRGGLGIYSIEKSTQLSVSLGDSKYPPVKNKKDLSPQKPLLEKSMDYMLKIIHNATGQWPDSKGIIVDDTD